MAALDERQRKELSVGKWKLKQISEKQIFLSAVETKALGGRRAGRASLPGPGATIATWLVDRRRARPRVAMLRGAMPGGDRGFARPRAFSAK
jgi:hypothetical protein